jgi:hypothetical protein
LTNLDRNVQQDILHRTKIKILEEMDPALSEYAPFRSIQIHEVNAAIIGTAAAGGIVNLQKQGNIATEFQLPEATDRAVYLPGVRRLDGFRIGFTEPDLPADNTGFRATVNQTYNKVYIGKVSKESLPIIYSPETGQGDNIPDVIKVIAE